MDGGTIGSDSDSSAPRYARFGRRLQGMLLDSIALTLVIFGALGLASATRSDHVSRGLGFLVVATLLLYEPVLVSLTGGTLGHHLTNLRVMDDRHGGNVGFLKASGRFAIKSVLGWFSFIVVLATRRSQALHDILTRSTVQIRNPAIARPHHFVGERTELLAANMPSRWRRALLIVVHLVLLFGLHWLVQDLIEESGSLSPACIDADHCSLGEKYLIGVPALIWLAASAICIGLGWRGKLPGARVRPVT